MVHAAHSERIARAYDRLAGEMRLFLTALRPHWTLERMATQHEELLDQLERVGPAVCVTTCVTANAPSWVEKSDLLTRC